MASDLPQQRTKLQDDVFDDRLPPMATLVDRLANVQAFTQLQIVL